MLRIDSEAREGAEQSGCFSVGEDRGMAGPALGAEHVAGLAAV